LLPASLSVVLSLSVLLLPVSLSGAVAREPAGRQTGEREERLEYETADGRAGYRRLVTREEAGDRTIETWVVEASSPNGGFESLLEVEEETVRIDATTERVTRREFATDPDGDRVLRQSVQEERISQSDGTFRVRRDISEMDLNGRPSLARRETETTTPGPDGSFRTETLVSTPGINQSDLVPTDRTLETGRRDAEERLLESDLTVYSDPTGSGRWEALERRITSYDYDGGETRTTENVYRQDASGDLRLNEQIVATERPEAGGVERRTEDVFSTDIPGERNLRQPQLLRQLQVTREESPGGGWQVTREVREDRQGRFRVVEREVETARPNAGGGVDIERVLERLDANGRMSRVSATSATTSTF
jgi:hypothetical protein